jgi:hypothetical protein
VVLPLYESAYGRSKGGAYSTLPGEDISNLSSLFRAVLAWAWSTWIYIRCAATEAPQVSRPRGLAIIRRKVRLTPYRRLSFALPVTK